MNLNQLWSGTDYAYYDYKGRNEIYRRNAPRLKVIRTFGKRLPGNTRETGYAEVLVCDRETGEPKLNSYGEHITKKVRARDIAMMWEEYEELEAKEEAERIEREAKWEAERQERDRLWQEREAARRERERIEREARERLEAERRAEQARKSKAIRDFFDNRGIDSELVYIDSYHASIKLNDIEQLIANESAVPE